MRPMQEDAHGRIPLTGREYEVLREMFGLYLCFDKSVSFFEQRAKTVPGLWRDLRMITVKTESVITKLLETIPDDKLRRIMRDLENTVVNVEVKRQVIEQPKKDRFTYVPEKAVETLIDGVRQNECAFCEKDQRAAKKCPYYKAIEIAFPYELPEVFEGHCRFGGYSFDEIPKQEDDENEAGK